MRERIHEVKLVMFYHFDFFHQKIVLVEVVAVPVREAHVPLWVESPLELTLADCELVVPLVQALKTAKLELS